MGIYEQTVLSTILVTEILETELNKYHEKCNGLEIKPLVKNDQGLFLILERIGDAEETL